MKLNSNIIKEPKISIIITFYNLGKYINDCVSSILNQTYQNFEIIIVNDCSDFANSDILNKISNKKIKIINLPSNIGQLCAFCEGLKIATGEFICMIDADDILLPNHLKTLLYFHLNYNYALISSSCGEINSDGEITSLNCTTNSCKTKELEIKKENIENFLNTDEILHISQVKAPFGLWSWNASTSGMFRKSALDILKFYPNKKYWKTGADKVIFSLLHLVGASANISPITYFYRHHDKNQSQTNLTTGNKKYLNENYIKKLISWNKQIRLDALKMFIKNKKELIQKFNKFNYISMYLKIIFCIDTKTCAKIIKTFAHKLINF